MLPTSSLPLHLPSTNHGADKPEVCLPHQKRLCIALGPRYEVEESSSAAVARPTGGFRADYGFVTTIDREIMRDLERDVGYGITDTWDEMLTEQQLMAGRLNMLYRDRRAHARTTLLMKREARMSREAWGQSMDASDFARSEVEMSKRSLTDMSVHTLMNAYLTLPLIPTPIPPINSVRAAFPSTAQRNNWRKTQDIETDWSFRADYGFVATIDREIMRDLERDVGYGITDTWDEMWIGVAHASTTLLNEEMRLRMSREAWGTNYGRNWLCCAGGCFPMIYGSVVASKLKTMQEAIEIATELMDKKIRTFAKRQTESKRKQDDNQQQQQQNKRQNTGRTYTAGTGEKKQYGGSKPLCSKCNYHHNGPCAPRCHKCNKVSHLARDCRSTANANNANNQRGTGSGQKPTCYECGA
ncbi:reverse transcriptase domain-containing protein [Tanacetum coccineum]